MEYKLFMRENEDKMELVNDKNMKAWKLEVMTWLKNIVGIPVSIQFNAEFD